MQIPKATFESARGTCHYQCELSPTSTVDLTLASSLLAATMFPKALLTTSPETAMRLGRDRARGEGVEGCIEMGCYLFWAWRWARRRPACR